MLWHQTHCRHIYVTIDDEKFSLAQVVAYTQDTTICWFCMIFNLCRRCVALMQNSFLRLNFLLLHASLFGLNELRIMMKVIHLLQQLKKDFLAHDKFFDTQTRMRNFLMVGVHFLVLILNFVLCLITSLNAELPTLFCILHVKFV